MVDLAINRHDDSTPLVDQITRGLTQAIDRGEIRTGQRLPSIRRAAETWGVGRNSVVEAYDRLVALGHVEPLRGSGFYVSRPERVVRHAEPLPRESREIDAVALLRSGMNAELCKHRPGWGGLPAHWLNEAAIRKALRDLGRRQDPGYVEYGHPAGLAELRMQLHRQLAQTGIEAEPGQIITTLGASQALDIVARMFLRTGDTVLVDDPGYYTLFAQLRTLGVNIVGVPRSATPLDTDQIEQLILDHRPVAYFINSVVHNPTGTSLTPACAHRLLTLAEKHDLLLVEDDVYGDFHPGRPIRLAALGNPDRVIYLSSVSKTLSSSLRVGYIVASPEVASRIMDFKMLICMSTPPIPERIVLNLLESGQHRRFLSGLRARLDATRKRLMMRLEDIGLDTRGDQGTGMYVWARLPDGCSAAAITTEASRKGIMLAPGHVFRPNGEPSSHLRFNIACSDDAEVYRVLAAVVPRRKTAVAVS